MGSSRTRGTEILNAPFAEGALLVTRASTPAAAAPARASTSNGNPLMPSRPPGPGGPRPPL